MVDRNDYDLSFNVPLSIKVGKKNFVLNQNVYRNSHFRVSSNAKRLFNDQIDNLNLHFSPYAPFDKAVRFHYYYYPKSKRSYDRMNVLSIIDKFTCDALIETGVLKDDNYRLVLTPLFSHVKPDKKNPRCEVYIKRE